MHTVCVRCCATHLRCAGRLQHLLLRGAAAKGDVVQDGAAAMRSSGRELGREVTFYSSLLDQGVIVCNGTALARRRMGRQGGNRCRALLPT